MSSNSASGSYFESIRRLVSPEITIEDAKIMLESEIDRDEMTRLRNKLGTYVTEDVERDGAGYTAYAVIHKSGTDKELRLPIGEMEEGEWDLHYGFNEFI